MKQKIRALHINEVRRLLDHSRIDREPVEVECFTTDGRLIRYRGWLVKSSSWRNGTHNLVNPVNGQVRKIIDILIININGYSMYL